MKHRRRMKRKGPLPPRSGSPREAWNRWIFEIVSPILERIDEPFRVLVARHRLMAMSGRPLDLSLPYILASAQAIIESNSRARKAVIKALEPVPLTSHLWLVWFRQRMTESNAAFFAQPATEEWIEIRYRDELEWREHKLLGETKRKASSNIRRKPR